MLPRKKGILSIKSHFHLVSLIKELSRYTLSTGISAIYPNNPDKTTRTGTRKYLSRFMTFKDMAPSYYFILLNPIQDS